MGEENEKDEEEEEEEEKDAEFSEEDLEEEEIESPEIKTLCDMGFNRDIAKRAICAAKGDLQQAALLCIEPVEASSPPSLTQQVSESKEGEAKSEYSDEDLMWRRMWCFNHMSILIKRPTLEHRYDCYMHRHSRNVSILE